MAHTLLSLAEPVKKHLREGTGDITVSVYYVHELACTV